MLLETCQKRTIQEVAKEVQLNASTVKAISLGQPPRVNEAIRISTWLGAPFTDWAAD
jgi:hypothetical protein